MSFFFEHSTLQFIWFTVFVTLLMGYVVLDGFDLGVGMLHLFSKKDEERRLLLNSIGPVWDGNEVWLVTAGGALFAGFPAIYATLCSAFYFPIIILLTGLIFRAVSIEFRSKQPMLWWRKMWDLFFTLSSLVVTFSLGIAMGNLIHGIPLSEYGEFNGSFLDFIHPYSILVGMLTLSLFTMHGAIYLMMKIEGELHKQIRQWVDRSIIIFIMFYVMTTVVTLIYKPHMIDAIKERPYFFLVAVANMIFIMSIPRAIRRGCDGRAFICSCFNIICLVVLYAIGTYPIVVRAINNPYDLSLTIYNASSSNLTLHILLLMVCIGAPLVIGYTITVYYIFRGKIKLDTHSY